MLYGIAILGVLIVAVLIAMDRQEAKDRAARQAAVIGDAHAFVAEIQRLRALPRVQTNAILKSGEVGFFCEGANLYELRAVRHYQSGSAGVRVAKGIYIGKTRGRSTSTQEWKLIDSGTLTVTNKRLIFDGGGEDRTIQVGKIISVEPSFSAVEVSVDGRQKSLVFEVSNPLVLAVVLRICCQAKDPCDISNESIDIEIQTEA